MKFMTMNEVAESLSVSRMTIYRLIKSGQLKALKVNKSVRIPESSFTGYIECNLKGNGDENTKKRRFSLRGMIKDGQVDDQALDEVKKIWESRELQ